MEETTAGPDEEMPPPMDQTEAAPRFTPDTQEFSPAKEAIAESLKRTAWKSADAAAFGIPGMVGYQATSPETDYVGFDRNNWATKTAGWTLDQLSALPGMVPAFIAGGALWKGAAKLLSPATGALGALATKVAPGITQTVRALSRPLAPEAAAEMKGLGGLAMKGVRAALGPAGQQAGAQFGGYEAIGHGGASILKGEGPLKVAGETAKGAVEGQFLGRGFEAAMPIAGAALQKTGIPKAYEAVKGRIFGGKEVPTPPAGDITLGDFVAARRAEGLSDKEIVKKLYEEGYPIPSPTTKGLKTALAIDAAQKEAGMSGTTKVKLEAPEVPVGETPTTGIPGEKPPKKPPASDQLVLSQEDVADAVALGKTIDMQNYLNKVGIDDVSQLPERALSMSLDKYQPERGVSKEQMMSFVNQIGEDLLKSGRISNQPRTWAQDEALRPKGLRMVSEAKPGDILPSYAMDAGRMLLQNEVSESVLLSRAAHLGNKSVEPELYKHITRTLQLGEILDPSASELGRGLSILRKNASTETVAERNLKAILKQAKAGGMDAATITARLGRMDLSDPQAVLQYIRAITKADFKDKAFEYWINAILSGPITHTTNMIGNTLTALTRPVESTLSAGIEYFRTLGGLTRPRERFFGEAMRDFYGMVAGLKDAVGVAAKAFRTEVPAFGGIKMESPGVSAIKGRTGRTVRIPTRALTAEDEFFKAFLYRGALQSLAYRKTAQMGLSGAERTAKMAELVNFPTKELMDAAKRDASYRTFQLEGGKDMKSISRFRNDTRGVRYLLPFVRTPINITKYGLERTPLNFLKIVNSYRPGQKPILRGELSDELAKAAMGTGIAAIVAQQVLEGKITGYGPREPGRRATWFGEGHQPYSWELIPGHPIRFGRVAPFGWIMGLIANVIETARDDHLELGDAAVAIGQGLGKSILDMVSFQGLAKALDAIESNQPGKLQKLIQGYAASPIPNVWSQVANVIDPRMVKPESISQALAAKLGFKEGILPIYDVYGHPVKIEDEQGIFKLVSPFRTTTLSTDPAYQILDDLKISVGSPRRNLTPDVKLTLPEYDQYVQKSGEMAYARISRLANKSWFLKMPEERKVKMIDRVFQSSRHNALQPIRRSYRVRGKIVPKEKP